MKLLSGLILSRELKMSRSEPGKNGVRACHSVGTGSL